MRAVSFALRAQLTGRAADAGRSMRLLRGVLRLQTSDGLFVDSPGGRATPVTYHAKFCAMLALMLDYERCLEPDSVGAGEVTHALRRGLDALEPLVSPKGVLAPFGRSRNTLFGYGAACAALTAGVRLFGDARYRQAASRLIERMRAYQRPDGHVPCCLNDREAEKWDWDVYINNPDYNAYAAAMLLTSGAEVSPGAQSDGPQIACSIVRRVGPLAIIRSEGLYAVIVAEGQSVVRGTPFFCDHRYYGMQPLHVEKDGQILLEPEPYLWKGGEDRRALVDPTSNRWLPYIEHAGRRYCVRVYDTVDVRETNGVVLIEGEGVPEHYEPVARWVRGVRNKLTNRFGCANPVFAARPLNGVRLRRRLRLNLTSGALEGSTEVIGTMPRGAVLCEARL